MAVLFLDGPADGMFKEYPRNLVNYGRIGVAVFPEVNRAKPPDTEPTKNDLTASVVQYRKLLTARRHYIFVPFGSDIDALEALDRLIEKSATWNRTE